eukprot:6209842-Pleurochrysis_carterae.AAC.3
MTRAEAHHRRIQACTHRHAQKHTRSHANTHAFPRGSARMDAHRHGDRCTALRTPGLEAGLVNCASTPPPSSSTQQPIRLAQYMHAFPTTNRHYRRESRRFSLHDLHTELFRHNAYDATTSLRLPSLTCGWTGAAVKRLSPRTPPAHSCSLAQACLYLAATSN